MDVIYSQLADLLEVEMVDDDQFLNEFESWDSLTILSLIAFSMEEHNVMLSNDIIRSLQTIGDLVSYIKERKA